MQVHDVVKIKAGRLRGLFGVVEAVAVGGEYATVRVEGVREGRAVAETIDLKTDHLEVR